MRLSIAIVSIFLISAAQVVRVGNSVIDASAGIVLKANIDDGWIGGCETAKEWKPKKEAK